MPDSAAALDRLANLPEIVIVGFDVFAGLEELVQQPDLAGLTNVTDSCITPGVIIGAICRRPHRYLFWDFVSPDRQGAPIPRPTGPGDAGDGILLRPACISPGPPDVAPCSRSPAAPAGGGTARWSLLTTPPPGRRIPAAAPARRPSVRGCASRASTDFAPAACDA